MEKKMVMVKKKIMMDIILDFNKMEFFMVRLYHILNQRIHILMDITKMGN
jgi:phage-related holin